MADSAGLVELVSQLLGPHRIPLAEAAARSNGGKWYLEHKILNASDTATRRDHARVLKYVYNFERSGAKVTFVRERSTPTPDLLVEVLGQRFYLEVRKFRMSANEPSEFHARKIVDAVTTKRRQLPPGEVGFVAIDNFDLQLESDTAGGLTHDYIEEALREIDRLARENPKRWQRPSGVLVAAMSSGGAGHLAVIPHFVWVNPHAQPASPQQLTGWLSSCLPSGEIWTGLNVGGMSAVPDREE